MHLLLAVDYSDASDKAVKFVSSCFGKSPADNLKVTLFHVAESLPSFVIPAHHMAESEQIFAEAADAWEKANQKAGEELLAKYRDQLVSAGLAASAVAIKLAQRDSLPEAKQVVAAQTIISEMQSGSYDVVVLGRRAKSAMSDSFVGTVASKVLREATGKTVWIVD